MRILTALLIASCLLRTAPAQAQTLFELLRDFRAARGLPALAWDTRLAAAAQNQADWMAANGVCCDHNQGGSSSASGRARAAGFSGGWISEIIYLGGSRSDAFNWWQGSGIHLRELTKNRGGHVGAAIAPAGRNLAAFVIVFGWNGGAAAASSGGVSGSPAQQPDYVLGLDEYGNIKHEVQPGDDLGTIAWRYYGYDWDVLPTIRALNNRTQDEDGLLAPGDILLIPPKAGTFTPAPKDMATQPGATPAASAERARQPAAINSPVADPVIDATPRPLVSPPPLGSIASGGEIRIGIPPTPIAAPDESALDARQTADLLELGLLALAVAAQALVIGGACLALWRRAN